MAKEARRQAAAMAYHVKAIAINDAGSVSAAHWHFAIF
jgi:hypothetical protein